MRVARHVDHFAIDREGGHWELQPRQEQRMLALQRNSCIGSSSLYDIPDGFRADVVLFGHTSEEYDHGLLFFPFPVFLPDFSNLLFV